MKRSEMINLIWRYVESIESDYDLYLHYDDISPLLDLIELAGMSPPKTPKEYPGLIRNEWEDE